MARMEPSRRGLDVDGEPAQGYLDVRRGDIRVYEHGPHAFPGRSSPLMRTPEAMPLSRSQASRGPEVGLVGPYARGPEYGRVQVDPGEVGGDPGAGAAVEGRHRALGGLGPGAAPP